MNRMQVQYRRQRGLTLVELMVSLVIGLLIVAATSMLIAGSSRSRRELEISADVIENGRYAIDVLTRELSQAGFYALLVKPTGTTPNVGSAMCARTTAALPQWLDSLPYYVGGLNSVGNANVDADPSCIARKPGTDALFIQRASTCVIGDASCESENANNAYFQVSECGDEYNTTPIVVAQGLSTSFTLQTKACDGTKAPKRKLIRRIYFISPSNALSYQDVTLTGALPDPVVLAENIEQMQLEYAVDTSAVGTPSSFTATPADWSQVIGVRVKLLAVSSDPSKNTNNAGTFVLSDDTTVSIATAAGNPKRRVYSTYIPFVSPKSRLES
jgi:type IV pilus assembly protein PilW